MVWADVEVGRQGSGMGDVGRPVPGVGGGGGGRCERVYGSTTTTFFTFRGVEPPQVTRAPSL